MGRDIPVLDLGDFDGARRDGFVAALREAVHEIGFFHLVGHGVPDELLDAAPQVAAEFFALDDDDRWRSTTCGRRSSAATPASATSTPTAASTCATRSTSAASCRRPCSATGTRRGCACAGPTCGRLHCPPCGRVMTAWMEALEAVGHRLLHAMSVALGQPADRFDATVDPPEVLLKVIRYRTPARRRGQRPHR